MQWTIQKQAWTAQLLSYHFGEKRMADTERSTSRLYYLFTVIWKDNWCLNTNYCFWTSIRISPFQVVQAVPCPFLQKLWQKPSSNRCISLPLPARIRGLHFGSRQAQSARGAEEDPGYGRECWIIVATPNHSHKPGIISPHKCGAGDPSYLSLSTAHQSRSSSCCSSCTGCHSGSQEALPLEVQSICFYRSQRYWSRGNLTGLCGTKNRATFVRPVAEGQVTQPQATWMSETSAACLGKGREQGEEKGCLQNLKK